MMYWLKLILNSDQDLTLSRQKQIIAGLLITKIYKNRTMKISLSNYSMLGYISPITALLFHIYRRSSCQTHILLQAFQNFSMNSIKFLINELIINLKYTFNIPFQITLKTIIMGTSSQFHDAAQLKLYRNLAQRYYKLLDWI